MTQEELKELTLCGERINLECKLAQTHLPDSLWETYSAFANTYGGTILLGVKEHLAETDCTKRFTMTGVNDADKLCRDLWNILNNPQKVNVNLLRDEDVDVVDFDGAQIIVIRVPQARYNLRPVIIKNDLRHGVFKRNHEGDYHVTEAELKEMLRDANESGNDGLLLEDYTLDDIDQPTLSRYRAMFSLRNPDHLWNGYSDREFLIQLGGYADNRRTKAEGLTLAGLLMFGKGLPIRERFDNMRLDYIDKSHLIGEQRWSDRLTYDGTWENNMFNFLRTVMPRLTRDLPRPFRMDGIERDDDSLQHKAVREAFTNAIIHSDFLVNGILKVEKLDNGIVFTNPGLLKLPIEQIYAGGESKARNQRMQNMFRMIGYGENLGSGFPLILHAWNEMNWAKPELLEQTDLVQVKLTMKFVSDKLDESLVKQLATQLTTQVKDLILSMSATPISKSELLKLHKFVHKSNKTLIEQYFAPAIKQQLIAQTHPDAPRHPHQQYYLTALGVALRDIIYERQ